MKKIRRRIKPSECFKRYTCGECSRDFFASDMTVSEMADFIAKTKNVKDKFPTGTHRLRDGYLVNENDKISLLCDTEDFGCFKQ